MRERQEAEERLAEAPRVPRSGPALLRRPQVHGEFLKRLDSLAMLSWSRAPRESAGVFFVLKRNSSLRMILDATRFNCNFGVPPPARSLAVARVQPVLPTTRMRGVKNFRIKILKQ